MPVSEGFALYLIGGAGRAGKSTLARRLSAATGAPYLHLDPVAIGIESWLAGLRPPPPGLKPVEVMWAILPGMLRRLIADAEPYIVNGGWLRPAGVAALRADHPGTDIRTVFLGYPDGADRKLETIMRDPAANTIVAEGRSFVVDYVAEQARQSAWYRDQCRRYDLRFCDTSQDFDEAIAGAIAYLTGSASASRGPREHQSGESSTGHG